MDTIHLHFDTGFTAITGETGAGKSVLLGALEILAGFKVDKNVIGNQGNECVIEGIITCKSDTGIHTFLETHMLPACEESVLLIKRTLHRQRPGLIQINGALAPLSTLKALGRLWIDFQETAGRLLESSYQLKLLDTLARNNNLIHTYRTHYEAWKLCTHQLHTIRSKERLSPDALEFIQIQLQKMQLLQLTESSIQQLEYAYHKHTRQHEWVDTLKQILHHLEDDAPINTGLSALRKYTHLLSEINPELAGPLSAQLQSISIECSELENDYRRLLESEELDLEAVEQLKERMQIWFELKRKYGPTLETVLRHQQSLIEDIQLQHTLDERIEALTQQAELAYTQAKAVAIQLTTQRVAIAANLALSIETQLKALGFKYPAFKIDIISESELKAHGDSQCTFLFSSNKGVDLLPLSKVASAGELARVMLTLKALFAQAVHIPILVFDEADANIGGEIAVAVASLLQVLSKSHQVFSVTHLPQVAGKADQHLVVHKDTIENRTHIQIIPIHGTESRVIELARMLGDRTCTLAIEHGRRLVNK